MPGLKGVEAALLAKTVPNHWNPARRALCACGWSGKFPTLRAANAVVERHLAEGCEGCDHAVDIWIDEEATR